MSSSQLCTLKPSGQQFVVPQHSTVLEAARAHQLRLPAACEQGLCGSCKTRLLSGEVFYRADTPALSDSDRQRGLILSCRAYALSDVELETLPQAAVISSAARVEQLERLGNTLVLRLKLARGVRLSASAGQYVQLHFGGLSRDFSLANDPQDELLELHIRHRPEGVFSSLLVSQLKLGTVLKVTGPLGHFGWHELDQALLVAGGTGMAPVQALLHSYSRRHNPSPLKVYWGARQLSELYHHHKLQQWAAQWPWLHYIPVLSAPAAEDHWQGRTGLVHQAVMADHSDLSAAVAYVCGAPEMVQAARDDFVQRCGLAPDRFYSDPFTPAGR